MLIIFGYIALGAGWARLRPCVLIVDKLDDGRIHAYIRLSFIFIFKAV